MTETLSRPSVRPSRQVSAESAPAATKRPKNWLLIKLRTYHGYLGVGVALLFAIVALTGIYLNHKDLFNGMLGLAPPKPVKVEAEGMGREKSGEGKSRKPETGGLSTATDLSALPVSFSGAMAIAREQAGDVPLEHLSLRSEKGTLNYRAKLGEGRELIIDANTGAISEKGKGYTRKDTPTAASSIDWGKLLKDLHTGQIGGTAGKLVADAVAVVLLFLTLSGLYLWTVPLVRKWRSRRNAAGGKMAAG